MKIKNVKKTEVGTGEIDMDYAEETFKELLAFQGYGFCKAHATSYSVYSAVQMWLQEHFFDEYMCALLRHIDRAKEKKGVGVLNERIEYCMKHGMTVRYPDVTTSTDKWELRAGTMYAPLKNIKGFSDKDVSNIISNREEHPFVDLKDFLDRTKFNHNKFETLLFARALSAFGDIEYLYNWYYNHYLKDKEKEKEREKKEKKEKKKKKKDESQLSLFEDEFSVVVEEEEEDSSSEVPEIIKKFTASELEDKCLDINGFVIHENIQNKYHEYFEQGMAKVAEVKNNESYNSPKRRIWKLSDIMQEEIEEDKFKNRWVLAKVTSEARGLMSKFGNKTFDKIVINDGYESITIMGRIPSIFKKGNVMVFPVSIINGKVHIDHYTLEKFDALILETAEDQGEKI
jgi:DNA polymerase III alpha subunit